MIFIFNLFFDFRAPFAVRTNEISDFATRAGNGEYSMVFPIVRHKGKC